MKKILSLCFALLLVLGLSACNNDPSNNQTSDNPSTEPFLTVDTYPVMDGSTANLPMMAEIMSQTCGISLEEAESLTTCTTTPYAWINLAQGDADILLVYEAAETTKNDLENIGTELETKAVGRDALVFIVNEDNPVDNLTTQQLIDIYSGKITNWKEVGGNDQEIVAYQRVDTSGSQSLFMKLLMKDVEPMEAPTELKPGAMGELIDDLASYNNEANAIGFSVFYYASYMYQQPGLKFISVDGVMPSDETIADSSYPFLNDFFVSIRADEPADSTTRQLYDWILSDAGTAAIKKAGYIPVN